MRPRVKVVATRRGPLLVYTIGSGVTRQFIHAYSWTELEFLFTINRFKFLVRSKLQERIGEPLDWN